MKYEFKGTKGEWFAVQYANYISIQPEDDYITYDDKPVKDLLNLEDCNEAIENGNLIVAAPDLLRACIDAKELIEWLYEGNKLDYSSYTNHSQQLKLAIEKALIK